MKFLKINLISFFFIIGITLSIGTENRVDNVIAVEVKLGDQVFTLIKSAILNVIFEFSGSEKPLVVTYSPDIIHPFQRRNYFRRVDHRYNLENIKEVKFSYFPIEPVTPDNETIADPLIYLNYVRIQTLVPNDRIKKIAAIKFFRPPKADLEIRPEENILLVPSKEIL